MHYLHECITCCLTPSHAITAADATAPIKAMHQVPLPKEVHIIVPMYYMSLPRAKGQAITCHCPAISAAIDPWQKSNSPNFRHYMPLPQVIGCDCPKTLHADASPIVVPGQGITCHCLTAYAPIAPRQYLSWPQGTVLHRRETKNKTKGCLVSWNGANRSSDWWIIGIKQCFQNVAITEVALNSKTFRERQQTSVGRNQKMRILTERDHFK